MFTKLFCQINQSYTKSESFFLLFNSAAYWDCFQETFVFELHFDYKSMHSLVFNPLVSNNCSIYT